MRKLLLLLLVDVCVCRMQHAFGVRQGVWRTLVDEARSWAGSKAKAGERSPSCRRKRFRQANAKRCCESHVANPSTAIGKGWSSVPQAKQMLLATLGCWHVGQVLAIAIMSSPVKWAQRQAQRDTWFHFAAVRSGQVRVRYFVGQRVDPHLNSTAADVNARVRAEAARHGDLEVLAHNESYHTISAKLLPMLTWGVAVEGGNAPFVMKTDDDTFVQVPLLLRGLEDQLRGHSVVPHKDFFAWSRWQMHAPVLRSGKWSMPKELFRPAYYPPFPSGPGISTARVRRHRRAGRGQRDHSHHPLVRHCTLALATAHPWWT